MNDLKHPLFLLNDKWRRIRSFVRRDGRLTPAQQFAFLHHWQTFGLDLSTEFNPMSVFHREQPLALEIGFGSGYSLIEMAKTHPDQNFIGIETHLPGIGTLLHHIVAAEVNNIRIYYGDALDVLTNCIPNGIVDAILIFFPDPWPKRRHRKRRLIQPEFVALLAKKLKISGSLHLATDWEDYGTQMMKVISESPQFVNKAGEGQFATRSMYRPITTKFEQRGEEAGRPIWELQYELVKISKN